jgi:hypothetical protein
MIRSFLALSAAAFSAETALAQDGSPPPTVAQSSTPAAPTAATDEQELEVLTGLLTNLSSPSRGFRAWGGISALALGGATVPAGIAMFDKGYNSFAATITLALGAGEVIGGILVLAFPSGPSARFQELSNLAEEQRAAGKSPGEIVSQVENKWRENADGSRSLRHVVGLLGVGTGTVCLAGGMYLAFADVPSTSLSKTEQYGFSAALLGLGYAGIIFGLQAFFFEEPVEAAWKTYIRAKPRRTSLLKLRGIGYAPAPGGGVLSLGATF